MLWEEAGGCSYSWTPNQKAPSRLSHSSRPRVTARQVTPQPCGVAQLSDLRSVSQTGPRKTQDVLHKHRKAILVRLEKKKLLGLHHLRVKPTEQVFGRVKYYPKKNTISPCLWLKTYLMLQCVWPGMELLTLRCGPWDHTENSLIQSCQDMQKVKVSFSADNLHSLCCNVNFKS